MVYNITIQDSWRMNLTAARGSVYVNGVALPTENLSLKTNTQNLIEIWANFGVGLNTSDQVIVGFNSNWDQLC